MAPVRTTPIIHKQSEQRQAWLDSLTAVEDDATDTNARCEEPPGPKSQTVCIRTVLRPNWKHTLRVSGALEANPPSSLSA